MENKKRDQHVFLRYLRLAMILPASILKDPMAVLSVSMCGQQWDLMAQRDRNMSLWEKNLQGVFSP